MPKKTKGPNKRNGPKTEQEQQVEQLEHQIRVLKGRLKGGQFTRAVKGISKMKVEYKIKELQQQKDTLIKGGDDAPIAGGGDDASRQNNNWTAKTVTNLPEEETKCVMNSLRGVNDGKISPDDDFSLAVANAMCGNCS